MATLQAACFSSRRIPAVLARLSSTNNLTSSRRAGLRGVQTHVQDFSNQMKDEFFRAISSSEPLRNNMAYSIAFASYQSLDPAVFPLDKPSELQKRQLSISQDQLRRSQDSRTSWNNSPLPRTLKDALLQNNRAIVITETSLPFRIVEVNSTWEGLCGYSFDECQGKTLGSLLQGPETNKSAVTALVSKLLSGEEGGAVLTNYTKEGRKFRNHLRVGPLMDGDRTTHFVGVLQEIHESMAA